MMPEEWVIWSYRILLGREPEHSDIVRGYVERDFSPAKVREALMASPEYQARLPPSPPEDPAEAELRQLRREFAVEARPGRPGFFIDFLGVQTRCSYLPAHYRQFSGAVEQADGTGAVPLHDAAEMVALLRTVKQASGTLTLVELGAGWGPWLVAGAAAARRRQIGTRLIGVEGDAAHLDFMRTHMADNAIDPQDGHRLLHAVVGAAEGTALFPVLPDPSADWGAHASAGSDASVGGDFVEVPSLTIDNVLADVARVDFLHCDIQGAEADAFVACAETLDAKVARIAVGTHGRAIEGRLLDLLSARGWSLEMERACRFREADGRLALSLDGVQVWRNTRLADTHAAA